MNPMAIILAYTSRLCVSILGFLGCGTREQKLRIICVFVRLGINGITSLTNISRSVFVTEAHCEDIEVGKL